MKFCENCGAELDDKAIFCDECGTAQKESGKEIEKSKIKKKGIIPVILSVIIVSVLIGVGVWYMTQVKKQPQKTLSKNTEKSVEKEESKTVLEAIEWKEGGDKAEEFKQSFLAGYTDISIEKALTQYSDASVWKYGAKEDEEYLLCKYKTSENENTLIFYKDNYGNINVAEYYILEEIQNKETMDRVIKEIFVEKTAEIEEEKKKEKAELEAQKIEFILSGSEVYNSYPGGSMDRMITVTVLNKEEVQVEIYIYEIGGAVYFEETYYGEILSENTVQFTLEAGEKINLVWSNRNTFDTSPVNGFSEETISMARLLSEALNNQTYTVKRAG